METNKYIIALDVGGSSVKSGIVDLTSLHISDFTTTSINSRASSQIILNTLFHIIQSHWQMNTPIIGVGLGFPGPFDYENGISYIDGVAKYEAIYGMNIHDALKNGLSDKSLPIQFRNDAEAAIVGEGVYGIGKGISRIIGLTLGTGLGSAFLIDGIPQTTGTGVPENGWVYSLPFGGEQVDDVFSTRGLLKRLSLAKIDVDTVVDAIQVADSTPLIRDVLAQFGRDLAQFLQPLVSDFGADAVILQGGIAEGFTYFGDEMRGLLSCPIFVGELGRDAALLGIAEMFVD